MCIMMFNTQSHVEVNLAEMFATIPQNIYSYVVSDVVEVMEGENEKESAELKQVVMWVGGWVDGGVRSNITKNFKKC